MNESRNILHEFTSRLRSIHETKCISDLSSNKFCIFKHIVMACDSLCENILNIQNTVNTAIDRRTTVKSTCVETVLNTIHAMTKCFSCISQFESMTDRSTKGPAAVATFDISKSTSFNWMPIVNAASYLTCPIATAAACQYLVADSHLSHVCL